MCRSSLSSYHDLMAVFAEMDDCLQEMAQIEVGVSSAQHYPATLCIQIHSSLQYTSHTPSPPPPPPTHTKTPFSVTQPAWLSEVWFLHYVCVTLYLSIPLIQCTCQWCTHVYVHQSTHGITTCIFLVWLGVNWKWGIVRLQYMHPRIFLVCSYM